MTASLRFLVDVGVGTTVEKWLVQAGYDTVAVRAFDPHASDDAILKTAVRESRIVVTMDKDFGELVFHSGQAHAGVVLLRMDDADADEKLHVMQAIMNGYADQLSGRFTVYKDGKLRIR